MFPILAMLGAAFLAQSPPADLAGYWEGGVRGCPSGERVELHVRDSATGPQASYGIPSLGLEGIPLGGLVLDRKAGTLQAPHQFDAKLQAGKLVGTLSVLWQHGPAVAVELVRAPAPAPRAAERSVRFDSGGVTLEGTLVAPLAAGRYPAMVSLHGSGPSTRWGALGRARHFAQAGYASLIYDKRGTGASGGSWTTASLDDAATEALDAMDFLRRQPEVDPNRVGLWGHSQAGWVISRAAAMGRPLGFAMVLAGGGSSPAEVERFGYRASLRHAEIGVTETREAMDLVERYLDYLRTGEGYEAITETITENSDKPWFRALGLARVLPTPDIRAAWAWVASYEPAMDIRRMKMPILLMFAGRDENGPPESVSIWQRSLREARNTQVESRFFPDGDHHFHVAREGEPLPALATGYQEIQVDWLARNVGSAMPR